MDGFQQRYGAFLFDLDGVLYLGKDAVPGAAGALQALRKTGAAIGFVTNNASRPPAIVAQHLCDLGIAATTADVSTSAQAIAAVMSAQLAKGTKVLIVGSSALADEIAHVGLLPVTSVTDRPQAVVQGYDPELNVARIQDACALIQQGIPWYASNLDLTIPTDRGIMPGMGSYVHLIETATKQRPIEVAGKPYPALMKTALAKLDDRRAIFVGDRLDTDIEGANLVGIDSLFVLSGAHRKADLAQATPESRPTYIGMDASSLLLSCRVADVFANSAICGGCRVDLSDGELCFAIPDTLEQQLDTTWAALQLIWQASDRRLSINADPLQKLQLVP